MNAIDIIKLWLIYPYVALNCNYILDVIINGDAISEGKGEKFVNEEEIKLEEFYNIENKYKISTTTLIIYALLSIKEKLDKEDKEIFIRLIESINKDIVQHKLKIIKEEEIKITELFLKNILENDDFSYGYEAVEGILPDNTELRMNGLMMYIIFTKIKGGYIWLNEGLDVLLKEFHNKKR